MSSASPSPPADDVPDARSALAFPAYRAYWFARMASTVASQVQVVAVGWQIYQLTDSAMALGLVGLVQFLPRALLVFVVGTVVDRVDRRRVLACCRVAQGLGALALALASHYGWLSSGLIYAFVLLIGTANSFEHPANLAIMPSLVPSRILPKAIALASSANQAATIAGPALGGFLYVAGPQLVYGVSGCLFLLAAALILKIQAPPASAAKHPKVSMDYLLAGVRFIRGHPVVLGAVSLDMFAVLLGGATALLPIYARDILHTGPWGLGMLRSAPAIGAFAVAVWLAQVPLTRRIGRVLLGSVAVFGLATLVFGISRWLPLSVLALVVLGGSDMISVVIRTSLVQLDTPDDMRGRVGSVNSLFIGASNQIGEFESGLTAAWFGAMPAVLLGGLGTLLVVALWFRWFPALAGRDTFQRE